LGNAGKIKSAPNAKADAQRRRNMMKTKTSCLLVLTVLLAGCWQKSVSPFYTEKDLISEPKLAGTWTEETESDGNRTTWTFNPAGDKRFDVVIQNKEAKHEFEGRLFGLGETRFLNLEGKTRGISMIPAHHLFRIELGAELKIAPLNTDWVQKWLRKNPTALAHVTVVDPEHREDRDKDELVLTADTKALQKFVLAHLNDKEFFVEATILKQ
jgi:hypothetical protein